MACLVEKPTSSATRRTGTPAAWASRTASASSASLWRQRSAARLSFASARFIASSVLDSGPIKERLGVRRKLGKTVFLLYHGPRHIQCVRKGGVRPLRYASWV
jgi:hypothetical protein